MQVSPQDIKLLPQVKVGNEIVFRTPVVDCYDDTLLQNRDGTIIAIGSGREFGQVLVLGDEPYAYLVPILSIA
jgi:hypothetical protein